MPSGKSFRDRTALLIGEEGAAKLASAKVLVAGLGGVGGTAFEALVRSGVGHFYLIDGDVVDESNLNRQLLFTRDDLGKEKTAAARERALSVNPEVVIESKTVRICRDFEFENLKEFDLVIDCIDSVEGKLQLFRKCNEAGKKVISSLGMGFRMNTGLLRLGKIDVPMFDPLAKALKKVARKAEIDLSGITFCFSEEKPVAKGEKIASMMMVPSAAGLMIAGEAIRLLVNN